MNKSNIKPSDMKRLLIPDGTVKTIVRVQDSHKPVLHGKVEFINEWSKK